MLFTKRGFGNVSMRDICRAAKVTPPTIYYYFKNKESLFEAVVRRTVSMSEFTEHLQKECSEETPPEAQIRSFIRTYLSSFPTNLINTGLYLRRSTELESVATKPLVSDLERIRTHLASIIRSGISVGQFRKTDPKMATECLLGMMNRFIFEQIHFGRSFDQSQAAAYVADFFLKAMEAS